MSILNAFKLDGKVALVTGASRGLGKALALGLAEAGADIVGLSRSAPAELEAQVHALGRHFHYIPCDLEEATAGSLQTLVDEIVQQMGRLDILINNAGLIRRGPAITFTPTQWQQVLQVNLTAAFFLAQAAAHVMHRQGGGKIIQIASVLAFEGGMYVPSYTVAKHGLAGMTRALANEWAPYNINVNAIAPGYFDTDMTVPLQADDARHQSLLARIPAGRFGRTDELKGMAVFLASAASDYVHGSVFPVDGGWLAR